jgi:hypothetical protein
MFRDLDDHCYCVLQRAKNHAGAWRYSKVAEGGGVRTSLLKPPFYARPTINGKQSWSLLNATTLESAKEEAAHLETGLAAQAKGLTVVELDATTNAHRIPLKSVIERYLDLKKNKAKKTVQQYRLALEEFGAIMAEHKVRFLDAVTVDALRFYADETTKRGFASKTLATRLNGTSPSRISVSIYQFEAAMHLAASGMRRRRGARIKIGPVFSNWT